MRYIVAVVVLALSLSVVPMSGQPAGSADITVDVGGASTQPSVTPPKPVARIGEDDFLTIQILRDGEAPAQNRALLRFNQPILELETESAQAESVLYASTTRTGSYAYTSPGASHHIRFRQCSSKYFAGWVKNGRAVTKNDCPLIVSTGGQAITIYANSDAVALDAWVDTKPDGSGDPDFDPRNTRVTPFTIRTVRPYWGLTFSMGPSFFGGAGIRDEQYALVAIKDDPATPNVDESDTTDQGIVSTGHGETPYELAAFATYMIKRPKQMPFGLTFGVSSKIPVDQLTVVAGVSARIQPFPITDSAFVTIGAAYRGHKQLMGKYRDEMRAPTGVSETDILESRHDIGLFLAFSFAFAGGETQFKSVVSGQ